MRRTRNETHDTTLCAFLDFFETLFYLHLLCSAGKLGKDVTLLITLQ
jgi:hypothetical protein